MLNFNAYLLTNVDRKLYETEKYTLSLFCKVNAPSNRHASYVKMPKSVNTADEETKARNETSSEKKNLLQY